MKYAARLKLTAAAVAGFLVTVPPAAAARSWIYIGSHDTGPGCGFSCARFDSEAGKMEEVRFLLEARSPGFFAIHPERPVLYAANSDETGGVSAYRIDPTTGNLTWLNTKPAGGGDTCFISFDRTGRYLLAANYQGGSVAVFALQPDGRIGERTAFDQHMGRSVNPERQSHPYAHSFVASPKNRFALAADLGLDQIYIYRFDDRNGTIAPHDRVATAPGSGPRHLRFHPNGRWVYINTELDNTITLFVWDELRGSLQPGQTVSALPSDATKPSAGAEIEVAANGRFLYVCNRGDDRLVTFSIDGESGRLTYHSSIASGGMRPRNFAFDPSGRWLVCTQPPSNAATVFRVNAAAGTLQAVGTPIQVRAPFCERFFPLPDATGAAR